MEHHSTEQLSKEEIAFNEMINRGNDLMKIQIFRSAKECYTLALDMNFNNTLAQEKLADCNRELKSESKTIIVTLIVMGIIVAGVLAYLCL
ncbi:MAG: hypothetical protein WCH34_06135 [Bacteroidota bacterium]